MSNQTLHEETLQRAQDPQRWLEQAEVLKAAGIAVVEKAHNHFEESHRAPDPQKRQMTAMPEMWMDFAGIMLWGFALENIFKGLIILNDPGAVYLHNNTLQMNWTHKEAGHGLVQLAGEAGEELSEDEVQLVSFLTRVTKWGGRYPVPRSIEALGLEWNQQRQDIFDGIYNRTRLRYQNLLP